LLDLLDRAPGSVGQRLQVGLLTTLPNMRAIMPSITDFISSIGASMLASSDPMNFFTDIDIGDTSFSLSDQIDLPGVDGLSAPCG
jgi:hypothetical protein